LPASSHHGASGRDHIQCRSLVRGEPGVLAAGAGGRERAFLVVVA